MKRITEAEWAKLTDGVPPKQKASKYGNRRIESDGILHDSIKESKRWQDLSMMQRIGEISDLKRQVEFKLSVNGTLICKYVADFTYQKSGETVIEDVKSDATRKNRAYRIKNKLMKACHGINIFEI